MSRAENKAERLLKMEALLLSHPEGLTQSEIARHLGVNRSVIHRNLYDFQKIYPTIAHDDGRICLDRSAYLVKVAFTLHEATAVHLAARLLATRMDKHNPNAASALRKLGVALEKLAPRISTHVKQSADVMDEAAQRHDPVYLRALEQLTLAWAEQRKSHIWHRSERTGKVIDYLFSPYFIEPYAVGQTTHLIGHSEPPGKLRTLKIERIERVELTHQQYEIPADFDPRNLLADAWGIWYTDNEPVEVTLRFHPRVAQRVRETRWHRSEEETEMPDGSILWKARVAEPQEMIPWIRGWGADCEVLEPKELRQALELEAQRIASLYKIVATEQPETLYFAHSKEGLDKSQWQRLKDHLTNTSNLAFELGHDAGISELARVAGLLHDIGKYSLAFQARLEGAPHPVDHATAGAREIVSLFPQEPHKALADLLSYCIAGHHGGLPDYGDPSDVASEPTLLARREKKQLEDYTAYKTEIDPASLTLQLPANLKPIPGHPGFSASFLIRMLFSTLVDADWIETETFMESATMPRGGYASISELHRRLQNYLQHYQDPQGLVNQKRTETLNACIKKATERSGFFTLTVPTGGGKTLASMAFALNHAVEHELKRVIYVIPFTSIIEQNAAVFKEFLGEENVLEHHSNFDWQPDGNSGDDETNSILRKLKLAAENWDIPIVVTTNVQFFESIFASKKSHTRKLHNIAKSVIIFDEAQMLPREYIQPCMLAVRELVVNYGASAVFCTATQPELTQFFPGITMTELAPDPQSLFEFYRRVQIKPLGKLSDQALAHQINAHSQVMCIVNTRRHAKGLFDLLEGDGRYHLSTLMCPVHRKETLATIRRRLQQGETCRVISTQVMEAGVDLDFPVGYRALAGLDSIIQAAGRVNRERRNPSGDVYVFEPDTALIKRTPAFIKQTASAASNILRDYGEDPVSVRSIQAYFQLLDTLQDPHRSYDVKQVLSCLDKPTGFDFKTAAEKFKLIDDAATVSIIVPYNQKARNLLESVRRSPYPTSYARQLQIYTVNVYEREFQLLQAKGAIETVQETYFVLKDMNCYNAQTGIILPEGDGGQAVYFD